jgi:hypothetical protein
VTLIRLLGHLAVPTSQYQAQQAASTTANIQRGQVGPTKGVLSVNSLNTQSAGAMTASHIAHQHEGHMGRASQRHFSVSTFPTSNAQHQRDTSSSSESSRSMSEHHLMLSSRRSSLSRAYPRGRGSAPPQSRMLQPLILNAPMMRPVGVFDVVTPAMKANRSDMLNSIAGDGGVPSLSNLLNPANVPFEEPAKFCHDIEHGVVHLRNVSS